MASTRHSTSELVALFEQALQAEVIEARPRKLYDPVNYILSLGGKRIRPVMLLMAAELYGGKAEQAVPAALGVEMFHNFSLVHDDIMDRAPVRRGKPTVHEKWDANTAILSGDTMLVMAYQYFLRLDHPLTADILGVFSKTAREVCEGQQFDMDFETRQKVSIDDYLEMIRLKTAVLIGASWKIGSMIAGAPKMDQEAIYDFGIHAGIAFQLKDDLLDTYGDEDRFGKRAYGDILTNKKTFLFLKALELADKGQADVLMHYYSGAAHDPEEKIREVLRIFDQVEVGRHTGELIGQYYRNALDKLDRLHVDEGKDLILDYTSRLMERNY